MSIKPWLAAALIRAYPKAWRAEYGAELADILMTRPLGVSTIGDVLANGCRQRVRSADTATKCGVVAMLAIAADIIRKLAAAPASPYALSGILEETTKTLPTVVVAPMMSELYALFLVSCGCWIHLRTRGKISAAGTAAMKISFIAGLPVMAIGLLMFFGGLGVVVGQHALNPWAVLFAPVFKLPESWIWGAIGGRVGRWMVRA